VPRTGNYDAMAFPSTAPPRPDRKATRNAPHCWHTHRPRILSTRQVAHMGPVSHTSAVR